MSPDERTMTPAGLVKLRALADQLKETGNPVHSISADAIRELIAEVERLRARSFHVCRHSGCGAEVETMHVGAVSCPDHRGEL